MELSALVEWLMKFPEDAKVSTLSRSVYVADGCKIIGILNLETGRQVHDESI
jgi:hypothetical protein